MVVSYEKALTILNRTLFYNHFARNEYKILFPTIALLLLAHPLQRKIVYRGVELSLAQLFLP
jgi:hypothetical protein